MKRIGLFSWGYSLLTALSVIVIGRVTDQISPTLSLLFSILLATLYFHILNWNTIPTIYRQFGQHWKLGLLMSFNLAITLFCTFYSLALTNSFSFIMVYFIVPALLSGMAYFYQSQNDNKYWYLLSVVTLMVTLICYITLHVYYAKDFISDMNGILLAALAGITGFSYLKTSYRFQQVTQLSVTQILAIRSYIIIALALCLIPLPAYAKLQCITLHTWLMLAFLSVITFIISIYCSQKGLQQMGVKKHSFITASCPVFAYVLNQCLIKNQLLPFPKLLLILAISTSVGLALSIIPKKE